MAAYNELLKGKEWDKVLAEVVVDPNIISNKGQIGWRLYSVFPAIVQAEMKKLKVGGLTKPVQTQYGYQIFRVDGFGKDALATELGTLKEQYVTGNQEAFVQDLRKKAKIERF